MTLAVVRAPLFSINSGVRSSGIPIGINNVSYQLRLLQHRKSRITGSIAPFSTSSALKHSHSHSNDTKPSSGDSHSHSHSNAPQRHPLAGHSHTHGDPNEFPELQDMDLEGEEFTIHLNEKKQTPWTRIKDFFNPHKPLHSVLAPAKKPEGSTEEGHDHEHSLLGGHSHSHSHSHGSDPEALKLYNSNEFWTNEGVKITWIGFGVNASMAITKFFGGIYFHSQALVADAVHAVGDLVSDVLTLSTVKYSSQVPSSVFPLGFGKIETLGSMLVSTILLYAGFQIGWSSLINILTPVLPHSVLDLMSVIPAHSHSHIHTVVSEGGDAAAAATDAANAIAAQATEHAHEHAHEHVDAVQQVTNINAAWLALGSIAIKEWLFNATKKIGEKLNSKVLIANAWHHRVDSLTSVVAVVTITSGYFLEIFWLDSVGGLLVSLLVMKVGITGVFQSFKELIDRALDKEDPRYTDMEDKINVSLMKLDSKIVIKDLTVLPSGTNLNASIGLGVGSWNKDYETQLTLNKIGEISKALKRDLKKDYPNLKAVSIEFESSAKPVEESVEEPVEEEQKEEVSEKSEKSEK